MNLLVKTDIVIVEPLKNKHFGYSVSMSAQNPDLIEIKKKSHCGRNRGVAGMITKEGEIKSTDKKLNKFITPEIRSKINFLVELAFGKDGKKVCKFKNGLIHLG